MENEKNITTDTNIVGTEGATHSDPTSVVSRTIGKTTYVANLHFKEQGQTFSQKLILQSKSQLKAIYKDHADTIEGNCDTMLSLGGKEKSTLKDMAEILGDNAI